MSIASEIQQKVMAQTGVWIRIGISSNKMLAKMVFRQTKFLVHNYRIL